MSLRHQFRNAEIGGLETPKRISSVSSTLDATPDETSKAFHLLQARVAVLET
jgi:hypothetical protein